MPASSEHTIEIKVDMRPFAAQLRALGESLIRAAEQIERSAGYLNPEDES